MSELYITHYFTNNNDKPASFYQQIKRNIEYSPSNLNQTFILRGTDIRLIRQINGITRFIHHYDNPNMNSASNGFEIEFNYAVQRVVKQEKAVMGGAVRGLSVNQYQSIYGYDLNFLASRMHDVLG